jgi:hypothetical protein
LSSTIQASILVQPTQLPIVESPRFPNLPANRSLAQTDNTANRWEEVSGKRCQQGMFESPTDYRQCEQVLKDRKIPL